MLVSRSNLTGHTAYLLFAPYSFDTGRQFENGKVHIGWDVFP